MFDFKNSIFVFIVRKIDVKLILNFENVVPILLIYMFLLDL